MALAYQSSQTAATGTGFSSVTVTKPTSLAVGDLMVGVVGWNVGTGTGTFPAGWEVLGTVNNNESSSVGWKIADSSDVAASNFTFNSGAIGRIFAGIMRITNSDTTVGSYTNAGGTSTATITPTSNSFIIITTHGNSSDPTSVSIENSTPTFTKAFSVTSGASFQGVTAWYGFRPENTATGTGSSTGGIVQGIHMFEVKVLPTTQTITDNLSTSDSIVNTIVSAYSDSMSSSDVLTSSKQRQWNNVSKVPTAWTNNIK